MLEFGTASETSLGPVVKLEALEWDVDSVEEMSSCGASTWVVVSDDLTVMEISVDLSRLL